MKIKLLYLLLLVSLLLNVAFGIGLGRGLTYEAEILQENTKLRESAKTGYDYIECLKNKPIYDVQGQDYAKVSDMKECGI